jgi:hypothetical protein
MGIDEHGKLQMKLAAPSEIVKISTLFQKTQDEAMEL